MVRRVSNTTSWQTNTHARIYSCAGKHSPSSYTHTHTHTVLNVLCTTARLHVYIHRKERKKSTTTKRNSIENIVQHRSMYINPFILWILYSDWFLYIYIQLCMSRRCACYPCEHERKTNRAEVQRKQFECSSHSMHTIVSASSMDSTRSYDRI